MTLSKYSAETIYRGGANMSRITQNQRVLEYIEEHGSITQLEALRDISVMRLASRISDLKDQGVNIKSQTVTVKNKYGETCRVKQYSIEQERKQHEV